MKNIFKYKSLMAVALLSTFASCSDDDDVTNTTRLDKPVITVAVSSASVTEGGDITVTLTSSKAISVPMEFKLDLLQESSTGSFRDYVVTGGDETDSNSGFGDIGHQVNFPAYTTEYTFTISPIIDYEVEGNETFNFRFFPDGNSRGQMAGDSSEFFTITVADYVSNDVGIRLVWDGNYEDWFGTIQEGTYVGADNLEHAFADWDFDIYVLDESFNDVTDFAGATSAVPEEVVVSSELPDGNYYIFADLFDSGSAPAEPFTFDMRMDFSKFGNWSYSIPISYYNNTSATSGAGGGLAGGELIVAVLTKSGNTWTLSDYESEEILISGRQAKLQAAIQNRALSKKKK